MNNDNDLNLHSMTKLSVWLRYFMYNISPMTMFVFLLNMFLQRNV